VMVLQRDGSWKRWSLGDGVGDLLFQTQTKRRGEGDDLFGIGDLLRRRSRGGDLLLRCRKCLLLLKKLFLSCLLQQPLRELRWQRGAAGRRGGVDLFEFLSFHFSFFHFFQDLFLLFSSLFNKFQEPKLTKTAGEGGRGGRGNENSRGEILISLTL
jgi:hypothetical protein